MLIRYITIWWNLFSKFISSIFCNKKAEIVSVKCRGNKRNENSLVPLSVNYHFTRQCNYECGFCFHTAKTSYVLPFEKAKTGLNLLIAAGMKKLNFSGGEPFIYDGGRFMGKLIKYCKTELIKQCEDLSISIVSNGSLIREKWMKEYGEYVDIIAISCDSFNEDTNKKIGRYHGSRSKHVAKLLQIRDWCTEYKVAFKINTVVNTYNITEDFTENIVQLRPIRWKVFQCLLLEGENTGPEALRNAEKFYINDDEFNDFLKRHAHVNTLVPESNENMKDSYLILDEFMRFLNCQNGKKEPSLSILDVGVFEALKSSGFDEDAFERRGGIYDWNKCQLEKNKNFEW